MIKGDKMEEEKKEQTENDKFLFLTNEQHIMNTERWGVKPIDFLLVVLLEEIGEIAAAYLTQTGKGRQTQHKDLKTEIIHTSAVLQAMYETVNNVKL
jgi:hypothetical protein